MATDRWIIPVVIGVVLVASAGIFLFRSYAGTADENTPESSPYRLSELGVEIARPQNITDLTYDAREEKGVGYILRMSTSDIKTATGQSCELGVFRKLDKSAVPRSGVWTEKTLQAARFEREGAPPQVMVFTDFYLIFEPNQAMCTDDGDRMESEVQKREALWGALTTARYIQY